MRSLVGKSIHSLTIFILFQSIVLLAASLLLLYAQAASKEGSEGVVSLTDPHSSISRKRKEGGIISN